MEISAASFTLSSISSGRMSDRSVFAVFSRVPENEHSKIACCGRMKGEKKKKKTSQSLGR